MPRFEQENFLRNVELVRGSGLLLQKRTVRPLNLPLPGCSPKGKTLFRFPEQNDVDILRRMSARSMFISRQRTKRI